MHVILKPFLEEQMKRLQQADTGCLLSEQAADVFRANLLNAACFIMDSTYWKMLSDEAAQEHPLAALDPALLTEQQARDAAESVRRKIAEGTLTLPQPLISVLRGQLARRTDALADMLRHLADYREEIGKQLLDGRIYTRITALSLNAGDTHRQGRSVCIVTTDAGKFVYKPRDMRGEQFLSDLLRRYLPDMVYVPACLALGDRCGVVSYIEKKRAEGQEEAGTFYRNFGALAAMLKALGSTDMHVENILCHGCRPAVVDLETLLSPVAQTRKPDLQDSALYPAGSAVFFTTLLPKAGPNDYEYSALMNCGEEGCAPEVNGRYVSVLSYTEEFMAGYREGYRRIVQGREQIRRELQAAAPGIMVRVLLANSQDYFNVLKKMYNSRTLADAETFAQTGAQTLERMRRAAPASFVPVIPDIFAQLLDGDIPYFYLMADSVDLMSGKGTVVPGFFSLSPLEHALEILAAMNDADEAFDEQLIRRSLEQYPVKTEEAAEAAYIVPEPDGTILDRREAQDEALGLLDLLCRLAVTLPSGKRLWGQISETGSSFRFCDIWLAMSLSGIAVFTSALQAATDLPEYRERAAGITEEILHDLDLQLDLIAADSGPGIASMNLGEAGGIGGLLGAAALIRRYMPGDTAAGLQKKLTGMLGMIDPARCSSPDRINGISGLLSVLCRFEEYRSETGIIRKAADRLLELKQLDWHDRVLWQSFPDKKRHISGGGHGMAGIAQALYAASQVLDDPGYMPAVREALRFEQEIYSSAFGTWPDLREYPPVGIMHGYCSGAPGIGIMLRSMREAGYDDGTLRCLEQLAAGAMERISLRERDHLCCGNSAIAEYYMVMGDHRKAGEILYAMKARKDRAGSYRYLDHKFRNSATASLFYGVSGIAYEMLRYAFPDTVLSLF